MKRIIVKISIVLLLMLTMAGSKETEVSAKIKTKKITIDLRGGNTAIREPEIVRKAKVVKVKSSKKSVVTVKFKKRKKEICFKAKKKGSALITVSCKMKTGKTKKMRYKVKVIKTKEPTDLERSKKAFAIQNQYRKAKGVKELQWSDEIYEFCRYRLKTSGYDNHANLGRDMNSYFGAFAGCRDLFFSENLTTGCSAGDAMESWKKSQGHYRNLLAERHVCGAIACYKDMWIAIFYDKDKTDFINWKSYQIKRMTIKRYDNGSGAYIEGSGFAYYEESKKDTTLKMDKISSSSGKVVYLEIGKSYVFYERIVPDGYEKAKTVQITVEENGINEIVLSN